MIPQAAVRKLDALRQAADDKRALAEVAKKQRADAEGRVQMLLNSRASEVDLAKAAAAVEAAQQLVQSRYRTWEDAEQLVARLNTWVNELPRGTVVEPAEASSMDVNGQPRQVVGELRRRIGLLAAQYHHIKLAPAPLDDAKAQARELVRVMGQRGRPPTVHTQFGKVTIDQWDRAQQHGQPSFSPQIIEALCWVAPDAVIAKLDTELEAAAARSTSSRDVLPLHERAPRLAEIERQVLDLELAEELVIERAHGEGVEIARRPEQGAASGGAGLIVTVGNLWAWELLSGQRRCGGRDALLRSFASLSALGWVHLAPMRYALKVSAARFCFLSSRLRVPPLTIASSFSSSSLSVNAAGSPALPVSVVMVSDLLMISLLNAVARHATLCVVVADGVWFKMT
jgi:hypothetical protein